MVMTLIKSTKTLSWILFTSLVLIYGSAFILIKWGLISYSPQQVASLRIFVGGIVLAPLTLGVKKITLSKSQWYFLLQSGLLGSLIPAFLFAAAEQQIDSGLASVLGSATPVFAVLISHFAFKYKLGKYQIPGLFLAFSSVIIIAFNKSDGVEYQWQGVIFILIATLCYAANMNFIKYKLEDVSPQLISSISLLFLVIPTGLILYFSNFFGSIYAPENLKSIVSITILGLTSTAVALILFIKLLKLANPLFTSSITFAIPAVAIFWGVLDGETVGSQEAISIVLMLTGIYLISKKD